MEHGCAASSTSGCGYSGTFGNWLNVKNRYLGLVFVIGGKTHYGWARLSAGTTRNGGRLRAVLTGYAYETIPGKAIVTGKTAGPDDAGGVEQPSQAFLTAPAPNPATLGLLATGSPGLSTWRRKSAAINGKQ